MKGRAFLEPARDLLIGPTEAHRRSAAGRAYYYKLASLGSFHDAKGASGAIVKASTLIDLLDAIESDAKRRDQVIATIRP